jgi:hypothetical protein
MPTGKRRLAALITVCVLPFTGLVSGVAEATRQPQLAITPSTASASQTVQVTGSGLPPRSTFQVQTCGQNAVHGSADCAGVAAASIQAGADGTLSVPLTVVVPPTACPCVVAAFSVTSDLTVTTPIDILGASTTPAPTSPPSVPRSHIVVAKSELAGSTPVAAWFGFPATRMLELTLRNTGLAPGTSMHLIADLDSSPLLNTHLAPLGPGQTRTYEVQVTFPALSIGNLNLNGHIFTEDGQETSFKVPFAIWPVGLLLAALLLIQMILLAVRNVTRRRYERNNPTRPFDPATGEIPIAETSSTEPVAKS